MIAAQHEPLAEVHAALRLTDSMGDPGSWKDAGFIPLRFQCGPGLTFEMQFKKNKTKTHYEMYLK